MKRLIALLLSAVVSSTAGAEGLVAGDAWVRATPPGSRVAAVYLSVDNQGATADRLLSVATPVAERAEVHETVHEGQVVRMRRVEVLEIAAAGTLSLEPGGRHLMLLGLKAPLVEGARVPLMLRFEHAGELAVEAIVVAGDATGPHAGHHHH